MMNSRALFLAALIVPVLGIGTRVLSARKIKLWPVIVSSGLVCWALLWFSYAASLDGIMRGSSADEDFASFLDGMFFLFSWIPASIYCGLWYAFFEFIVSRKLRPITDK